MSHTAKIETKFTQIGALKRAFEHFGWKITENTKARTYSGDPQSQRVYKFVAVNPSTSSDRVFDLGVDVKDNGELEVYGDFWGGSIAQTLGNNLAKLRQEYAFRVIEEKFAYEGASVQRTVEQDGSQVIDVQMM